MRGDYFGAARLGSGSNHSVAEMATHLVHAVDIRNVKLLELNLDT